LLQEEDKGKLVVETGFLEAKKKTGSSIKASAIGIATHNL